MILIALLLQVATPAEQAAMEAAVVAADTSPRVDCVGQPTQLDMNVCSFRDFEKADAALNRLWKVVVSKAKRSDRWSVDHHFPGGEFGRALDAQRKWLAFRDAQCLYEIGTQEDGGTIWPLLHNGCMKNLTEARIDQLRATLEPSN